MSRDRTPDAIRLAASNPIIPSRTTVRGGRRRRRGHLEEFRRRRRGGRRQVAAVDRRHHGGSSGRRRAGQRMLRLDVAAKVDLALERARLLADAAREGLEAGVLATVRDQVGRLAERLAALATAVRLFTCNRYVGN